MQRHFHPERLLRREQLLSAAINAVLSAAFFALVFGIGDRALAMAAPDSFALDFLPQGAMVSLMASLVPALAMRGRLRKSDFLRQGRDPSGGRIVATTAKGVLLGLSSGALLFALARLGPLAHVPSYPALAFKILYGAGLGAVCTRLALTGLFEGVFRERTT